MALALGWPSVAWGLEHISARELAEWEAFAQLEPFGEWRADVRAGIIASTVANVNRDAKKHSKPFSPDDFMPKFEQGRREQTPDEQVAIAHLLQAAFGGTITKGKP